MIETFGSSICSFSRKATQCLSIKFSACDIIENNVVNNVNEQNEDYMEEESVILDSGSDVSLLPRRHQRNLDETTLGCKLQNCQGGALEISGTKQAELYGQDREGQGVILQHTFIVGDVQSCIISLRELAITKVHTAACLGLARFYGPQ